MRLITIIKHKDYDKAKKKVPGLGVGRTVKKVWNDEPYGRVGSWLNPSQKEIIELEKYADTFLMDDDCLLGGVEDILKNYDPELTFEEEGE